MNKVNVILRNKIKGYMPFFLYLVVKCLDMKLISKFLWKHAKPITYIIVMSITIIIWTTLLDYILSQIK